MFLEIVGDDGVEVVPLDGDRLTLGRSRECTLAFPSDESMSRSHAELARASGGWSLRDVGSSNGTYVNGSRLQTEQLLRSGDEVSLGDTRLVFRSEEASVPVHAEDPGATKVRSVLAPAAAPAPPAESASAGYLEISEEWHPEPATPARSENRAGSAGALKPRDAGPRTPEPRDAEPRAPEEPRRHGTGKVRGTARGVQVRSAENGGDVLSFRIDRYDAAGNRLPPIGVEVPYFGGGHVGEGEEVEVVGRWSRGTLMASKVTNLATNAEVRHHGTAVKIVLAIAVVLILCFFAFLAYSIISSPTVHNPFK